MIIYLCIKFESNILIFSKDIEGKPFLLCMGWTGWDGQPADGMDAHTDRGDTICTPKENGGGIKKQNKTRQSAQWGKYTPDQSYRHFLPPLFKEHKVCSFDSGDGSCMLYVITLKRFNHT